MGKKRSILPSGGSPSGFSASSPNAQATANPLKFSLNSARASSVSADLGTRKASDQAVAPDLAPSLVSPPATVRATVVFKNSLQAIEETSISAPDSTVKHSDLQLQSDNPDFLSHSDT